MQFDKERFRNWLISRNNETVGYRGKASSCPIATYARCELKTYIYAYPLSFEYLVSENTELHSYEDLWVTDFILALDKPDDINSYKKALIGHDVLPILDSIS